MNIPIKSKILEQDPMKRQVRSSKGDWEEISSEFLRKVKE